jgi:PTH1 family peptidyl-tRNA hydrolase
MSFPIQLIVGLANPGKEYADTRHNAGAWLVEDIAKQAGVNLHFDAKLHGFHAGVNTSQAAYHLLIPTTFMNHSGIAVHACMNYYKIAPHSILIVHDEIDLPAGTIKIKFDGGDGGHNGLKDIIRHLHTKQFYRCRIGVGRPTHETADYVLSPPSKSDKQKIEIASAKIHDVMSLILSGELSKAMQLLHTET